MHSRLANLARRFPRPKKRQRDAKPINLSRDPPYEVFPTPKVWFGSVSHAISLHLTFARSVTRSKTDQLAAILSLNCCVSHIVGARMPSTSSLIDVPTIMREPALA